MYPIWVIQLIQQMMITIQIFGDRAFISSNRIGSKGLDIYEIIKNENYLTYYYVFIFLNSFQNIPECNETQINFLKCCILLGEKLKLFRTGLLG